MMQAVFAAEETPVKEEPTVEEETVPVIKVKPIKIEDYSNLQKAQKKSSDENSDKDKENPDQKTKPAPKAVDLVDPKVLRRTIDIADIDSQDVEIGGFYGVMSVEDFGSNPVYGGFINYHVTEDIFIGARYGLTTTELTSFERLSGARLLTDSQRDLTYYDLNIGLNLLPGEGYIGKNWSFNSNFYATAGVGSTKFAGDNRFTINWTAGYQIVLQDWLAFHVELQEHMFEIDILGSTKVSNNLSVQSGFSVYF